MAKQYYKDDQYHFYQWWKDVYQQEMDLYERWSSTGAMLDGDYKRWEILRAYFRGLCHGRKRVTERP